MVPASQAGTKVLLRRGRRGKKLATGRCKHTHKAMEEILMFFPKEPWVNPCLVGQEWIRSRNETS